MSYFKSFPLISDYNIQGEEITGVDITRFTKLSDSSTDNKENYIVYRIKDGETPEMLADRIYDDASMAWVILIFNRIFSIDQQWPMQYNEFDEYVNRFYGDTLYDIKEYRSLSDGSVVDEDHVLYDRLPVTNYDYEVELNDAKKNIKIPTPQAARQIKRQHRKEMLK